MLIDAHCHINSLDEAKQKEILNISQNEYIFIDVSIDLTTTLGSLTTLGDYEFVYHSLGFHPLNGGSFSSQTIERYRNLIRQYKRIIAIGEIGLDYKSSLSFKEQKDIFEAFINLSKEFDLPVVIHNRWNDDGILGILNEYFSDYTKIIFHCFSQDISFLRRIIDRDGNVSFSLNVLRNKTNIKETLRYVPLDKLLLETDSPYMKVYGEYSTPLDIKKVYNYTAETKNISLEKLEEEVYCNAQRLFFFQES